MIRPIGPGSNTGVGTGTGLATDIDYGTNLTSLRAGLGRKFQYYTPSHKIINYTNLNVDHLGAGQLDLRHANVPGAIPTWEYSKEGLRLGIERPPSQVDESIGHFMIVDADFVIQRFLLLATFRRPLQEPGSDPANYTPGIFAAAILFTPWKGSEMGISCQVRPEGVRVNLPGTGLTPNRAPISSDLAAKILDPDDPSLYTLALRYDRGAPTAAQATAALFVGDETIADTWDFALPSLDNVQYVTDVRAGIGTTGTGRGNKASVDLIDVQVWHQNVGFMTAPGPA